MALAFFATTTFLFGSSYMYYSAIIEKLFVVEVVTFNGETLNVEVFACNADDAQAMAAEIVGDADYTSVIYCE